MIIAYTLCSVNYFAQAHTLGESLQRLNPDIKFIIGVVDKLDDKDLDEGILPPFDLLEVHRINIEDFCGNVRPLRYYRAKYRRQAVLYEVFLRYVCGGGGRYLLRPRYYYLRQSFRIKSQPSAA